MRTTHRLPSTWKLEPGAALLRDLDFESRILHLRIRDPRGQPIANQSIWAIHAGQRLSRAQTDAQGLARLLVLRQPGIQLAVRPADWVMRFQQADFETRKRSWVVLATPELSLPEQQLELVLGR